MTTIESGPPDNRRSPIPTFGMIATRFTELRKRRGLMATVVLITVGIPVVFLTIRLILHWVAPKTYGLAGGYDIYTAMVSGVLYLLGFIVAAALGATAGSGDLSDGMFRHEVITGRSRVALYLARIPAGFAIIGASVAIGFAFVCAVCVLAAPKHLQYDGVTVPGRLSKAGLEQWAVEHPNLSICGFGLRANPTETDAEVIGAVCPGPGPGAGPGVRVGPRSAIRVGPGSPVQVQPTQAQIAALATRIADDNYSDYSSHFLSPPASLMIDTFLWLELEALIGFTVALGLGSLTGQRSATIILLIILEVILTPILSRASIPHMINIQRGVVGLAMAHIAPGALPVLGGGRNGGSELVAETKTVAGIVIACWLVGWSIIGAWRMKTRDA